MTNNEENKLSMYHGVFKFLRNNSEKSEQVPVLNELTGSLEEMINAIDSRHERHQTVASGAAQQKGVLEDVLVAEVVAVASVLYSYAVRQGYEELKSIVKVTESGLKRMRDTELLSRSRTIGDRLEQYLDQLADYGITEATLADLQEKINAYAASLENREAVSAEKTSARQSLSEAFDDTDDFLYNQLDPAMEVFRNSDTGFYNTYQNTRSINDMR